MKKRIAVLLALILALSAGAACGEGWVQSGGRWWYDYGNGGYAQSQWLNDGAWYYFDADGWMATGWMQIGGVWYYLGDGAMTTGWRNIGGTWYYFDGGGAMATGWQQIDGAWYYFDGDGAMATGWRQIDGLWYYFSGGGSMMAGWQQIGSDWYLFADSGEMSTGWEQSGGAWYYLTADGDMATGWQQISGTWYYFDESGVMQTGWLKDGDDWYYLNDSGVMVTSDTLIDGVLCAFDASGVYQGEAGPLKLIIWSFTNEMQAMIEKYYAPDHPEVEFEFAIYPTDENVYLDKVDSTLAADATGEEAPDIFTMESAFVKHYVESDMTGDLKAIGFTDAELSTAFPVMAEIGQTADGVQKGLSWQSTPGALMYRASLAEKYLGVTSPEEMQALVSDWDTFLETARKLEEASGGACKIVTGSDDIWNAYQYQRDQGWIVDGELNIDSKLLDYEELCKALEQEDLTHKTDSWGETWFAGMRGELETLCYFLPTWGLHYTLKPNCTVGADYAMNDEELQAVSDENGGTFGDWRMTDGPVAYSWGGTWIGVNAEKAQEASEARKEAMHDLISYLSLDEDFLVQYAKDTGDFVGNAAAVQKILDNGGTPNPFLGGQDHYAIFAKEASLANGKLMSKYDSELNDLWENYVTVPYSEGESDLDACIEQFTDAAKQVIAE